MPYEDIFPHCGKSTLLSKVLLRAVSTRRPHGDQSTAAFCAWLRKLLPSHEIDGYGNIHVDKRPSRTLFVAHVDTVHKTGGKNKFKMTKDKLAAHGAPLGADDGAGVAMLVHLIAAGVPGYYIFTQGEERGGLGARYLMTHQIALLRQFDRAIAFDRRGIDSVITHQSVGRCCSDAFADALAERLGGFYSPDPTGVYTDTAEFVDVIPECTNISVGYDHEHSDREVLDLAHFYALSETVLTIPWESLPTVRDPDEYFPAASRYEWGKLPPSPLYAMSKGEMYNMAYSDPDTFVQLVREELGLRW